MDLKDFLLESLEVNGTLDIIKSELKNNLFNTLREESPVNTPSVLEGDKGEMAAELVRDFFETFCMQYSLSVFLPESKLSERPFQREALEKKVGLKGTEDLPLLTTLIANFKKGENSGIVGESINSSSSFNIHH